MRHRVAGFKLGRTTPHRKAMWRNMAVSLFTHGQITTTVPKAKSLKPFVEKMISDAKQGDLAARRRVISALGKNLVMIENDEDTSVNRNKFGELKQNRGGRRVVTKLFDDIAAENKDRNGGYTRIIRLTKHRIGDAADLCVLQLVSATDTRPKLGTNVRRAKANKRNEYAAQLRKAKA